MSKPQHLHHQDEQHSHVDYGQFCEIITALIPAYSVGATNPNETRLVEALLDFCPEARAELVEYRRVTDNLLYLAVDAGSPPPLSALMARVAADEQETATMPEMPPAAAEAETPPARPYLLPAPTRSRRGSYVLMGLLTASIVLLTGITLYTMTQLAQFQRDQSTLLATLAAAQAEQAVASSTITISGPDRYRELQPAEPVAEGAEARFVWNVDQQVGAVFATGLPQLPSDQVYQVWVVTVAGEALSLGTFTVDAQGEGALVFKADRAIENYTHIGISIEPQDGSLNPTTPHLVIGMV